MVDFVSVLSLFVYSAIFVIAWVELFVMYSISDVREPTNLVNCFSIVDKFSTKDFVDSVTFSIALSIAELVVERCEFITSIFPANVGRFCDVCNICADMEFVRSRVDFAASERVIVCVRRSATI